MAIDVTIKDNANGTPSSIDLDGQSLVTLNKDFTKAGIVRLYTENDQGIVTGTATGTPLEGTPDFRLRVGIDTLLDSESFNYAAQNTGKFILRATTMTATWAGGFFNTNGSGITTINSGVLLQTRAVFPLYGAAATYIESSGSFTAWTVTNSTIDFSGLFLAAATTPFAPTDGVYFRVNSAGIFGVSNYNGTEQTTSVFKNANNVDWAPVLNQVYKFAITYHRRIIKFWIDDVLMGTLLTPNGTGQSSSTSYLPFGIRHAIGGTAASSAMQFKCADYSVGLLDYNTGTPSAIISAAMGSHGYQGQSGGTMGSTAKIVNNTNPAAAVPTNTTAALGVGLGGDFWHTNTLAVNTDGIISSYQVPTAAASTGAGRQLVITGVRIDTSVQTVLAGGPFLFVWTLAFGHTAVSLATTEAATTKAPRRISLGIQSLPVTAPVGTSVEAIFVDFSGSPIVVNPDEFVQTAVKNVGVVGTSGVLVHTITFISHWK
jgi:hypothetical protein